MARRWNFLRTPRGDFWSLSERPGWLRLRLKPEALTRFENPSFVGRRQQHMNFAARTVMEFRPQQEGEAAGMVLLQSNDFHYRFEYAMIGGQSLNRLVERKHGEERVLVSHPVSSERLYLIAEANLQSYRFDYAIDEDSWITLFENVDGTILSPDVAGWFEGRTSGCMQRATVASAEMLLILTGLNIGGNKRWKSNF